MVKSVSSVVCMEANFSQIQSHLAISTMDTPAVHQVIFDALDASVVCAIVLHTVGAVEPSGIDACGWQGLCTVFHAASDELCGATALFAW